MLAHLLSVVLCFDILRVFSERTSLISYISPDQQKFQGEQIDLNCGASPVPNVDDIMVMWLKNTYLLSSNDAIFTSDKRIHVTHFPHNHSYSLSISDVQEGDSGDYSCKMVLGEEIHTNTTKVIVQAKNEAKPDAEEEIDTDAEAPALFTPTFLSKPLNITVKIGANVTLPCDLDELGDAYVLLWKKETSVLTASRLRITHNDRLQLLPNLHLNITSIQPEDAGTYICQISTKEPMELKHIVQLEMPPTTAIVTMAQEVVTEVVKSEGEELKLLCRTTGNPSPQVKWKKLRKNSSDRILVTNTSLLHLPKVTRESAGIYICEASNNVGMDSRSQVILHTQFAPKILKAKEQIFTGLGLEAELRCEFEAFPSENLTWYLNGRRLENSLHYTIRDDVAGNGNQILTLKVKGVTSDDLGNYTCAASNRFGTAEAKVELTGRPSPVIVRKGKTSARTTNVHIDWETISYVPIIEYKLHFRMLDKDSKSEELWEIKSIMAENQEGSHQRQTFDMTDLKPRTTYQVMIIAKNQFGWSSDSNILEIKTAPLTVKEHSEVAPGPELDVGEVKPEQSQQPGNSLDNVSNKQDRNLPAFAMVLGLLITVWGL